MPDLVRFTVATGSLRSSVLAMAIAVALSACAGGGVRISSLPLPLLLPRLRRFTAILTITNWYLPGHSPPRKPGSQARA